VSDKLKLTPTAFPEANIDKIIATGAIPRLIELMRSEDIDVRRNSTGALANLASAAGMEGPSNISNHYGS